MILTRTCKRTFKGGPSAWYCPECGQSGNKNKKNKQKGEKYAKCAKIKGRTGNYPIRPSLF